MNNEITKNTWRVGSTTVNRKDMLISLREFFLAFIEFKNETFKKEGIFNWKNKTTTIHFTEFCNEKYPSLFKSNKQDKAEIARQVTALLMNYGLVNKDREITKYGDLFNDKKDWVEPVSNYFDISYDQTVLLMSLLNERSDNGSFKPMMNIIGYLLSSNNREISLDKILATHKAQNSIQFKSILSGVNPVDLMVMDYNFDTNIEDCIIEKPLFLNSKSKNNNLYIKNIYKIVFDWFDNNENSEFCLDNDLLRKSASKVKKTFLSIEKCFKNINRSDITLIEMNNLFISSVANIYIPDSYRGQTTQTCSALRIMGIFSFNKNKKELFLKLKNDSYEMNDFEVLSKSFDEIIMYFENKKPKKSSEKKDIVKVVSALMDKYKVFDYFHNDELFLIPGFPIVEVESRMKRFVCLEWLVGIKLSKIFNLDLLFFFDKQRLDNNNILTSHRPGLNPDFEYKNTLVEVTTANGVNIEKLETEPVTRHLAKYKVLNPDAYCLFFGSKNISPNFYWDSFMKKEYVYFDTHSKTVVKDLNIIVCEYTVLDNLKIEHIDKLLHMHKSIKIESGKLSFNEFEKFIKIYKEKIYEISCK